MDAKEFNSLRKSVKTPYGEIAYAEKGSGPVALFVHGVLLNGYLWRDSIDALSNMRRCVALDLMGHGATKTPADADMSFDAQVAMIGSFLDALGFDQVDLLANDSGGGIAQIFAAKNAQRIRSLVLTNCDTHDNYPPPGLEGLVGAAKAGQLGAIGKNWLANPDSLRASFGVAYERPEALPDENAQVYLGPLFATEEATRKLERFIASVEDNSPNVRIEPQLRQLQAPTLIIWGTDDVFFDKKWAYWLKDTIPGAREVIEVPGAKLFFPEERPEYFAEQVRKFWQAESVEGSGQRSAASSQR
jgi:pimeloyl-ACP methyl ester carboxylesterase